MFTSCVSMVLFWAEERQGSCGQVDVWCPNTLSGSDTATTARRRYFPKVHEPRVPEVILRGPFHILEASDQNRPQPQWRIPDYAASGVASVVIAAFSVILRSEE